VYKVVHKIITHIKDNMFVTTHVCINHNKVKHIVLMNVQIHMYLTNNKLLVSNVIIIYKTINV